MTITKINGELYHKMLCGAVAALQNRKEEINSMNVFPVPDGDTGTNMFMTLDAVHSGRGAVPHLGQYAETSAREMMRAARGNSGVILSLFFRGMAKAFAGHESADAALLTEAFRVGAEEARKAVLKPVEGTILTVMRECCSFDASDNDLSGLLDKFHKAAYETLKKTPEMLPVLKRARVVDSGGLGFTAVLDGMKRGLVDDPIAIKHEEAEIRPAADFHEFETGDIKYAYCTECLVSRKPGVTDLMISDLRDYLNRIGDSIVLTEDDEIIKLHVHSNEPLKILSKLAGLGEIQFSKIENMRTQHQNLTSAGSKTESEKPEKKYGIIAVSSGAGLTDVFRELGADAIVTGGQSMNPSAEDFLKALKNLSCEHVIILPNNSNIVLTALQAAKLAEGRSVEVVKSVTIPQGISALIAFDSDLEVAENIRKMTEAMSNVTSIAITRAVRSMDSDKITVRKNQIIGIVDKDLKYATDSLEDCLRQLAADIGDKEIITIYYGKGIEEDEAKRVAGLLSGMLGPGCDIVTIPGEQPVYMYIISAE
ncbi:MAG: DAK2 domain-containing protein [Clostridiales bacterium]|nr:DAK2 domain-containing protein [Clostridiales bacterium]